MMQKKTEKYSPKTYFNPSNAEANFHPKHKDAKIFEMRLN